MEMPHDEYHAVASESTAIFRDKASKFIAFVFPVNSEEDVKKRLEILRKEYFDANHHCYAYRIGHEQHLFRTNDDGEPSGSAGKPIYGQILSSGLSDVLVVVIRYFGGTKLGIPGLIHAYKTAAREALDKSETVTKYILVACEIEFEYATMNQVMRVIKEESAKIISQKTNEYCSFHVSVRIGNFEKFKQRIINIRNVRFSPLNT